MENRNCQEEFECPFGDTGICAGVDHVDHQRRFGAPLENDNLWERDMYDQFRKRVKTKMLPYCLVQDELKEALDIEPEYLEDTLNP